MKLSETMLKTNEGRWVFIQIIKLWSTLPKDIMDKKNIYGFKERLDKYLEVHYIKGY